MNVEAALVDVELDCAFALYYAHGKPVMQCEVFADDGVIGWAKEKYPAALAEMVVRVGAAIAATLQKHDATPMPMPAPESGVEWEEPNLNTPDGSSDFEVEL